jgi:hypothetical protein
MYGKQGFECSPDIELRVKWLNGNTVMLVEKFKKTKVHLLMFL